VIVNVKEAIHVLDSTQTDYHSDVLESRHHTAVASRLDLMSLETSRVLAAVG
jgi:hypothetical protein